MASSIRELIIQSIQTQLQAITIANGYDFDVKTVKRARRRFTLDELPAISIFDQSEDATSAYNIDSQQMIVIIELHDDAVDLDLRSPVANMLLATVKKALLSADTTHGGKAQSGYLNSSAIEYPPDDDVATVNVNATFTVKYEEVTGDPYINP